jgi:ABC-type transport system involved in Fe-S cluster assembly fused permease/ATPase subunit
VAECRIDDQCLREAIAGRLSTVRNADQIVVLEHGHVIEPGDHASLTASQGRYAALAAWPWLRTRTPRRA